MISETLAGSRSFSGVEIAADKSFYEFEWVNKTIYDRKAYFFLEWCFLSRTEIIFHE